MREIRRVLKPGGYLLARTNAQSFPRKHDDIVTQYHTYEPNELRVKFHAAGFHVVRLSRVNAVLGLAEIPRELKARQRRDPGILAPEPTAPGRIDALKREWLSLEGTAVVAACVCRWEEALLRYAAFRRLNPSTHSTPALSDGLRSRSPN